jgi:hypothetical protein
MSHKQSKNLRKQIKYKAKPKPKLETHYLQKMFGATIGKIAITARYPDSHIRRIYRDLKRGDATTFYNQLTLD